MPYTEKAGISLPVERPDVDAILSAIAHLQLAAEFLDAQRSKGIKHMPKDKRDRMYERLTESMDAVWEQHSECCDALFYILRPDSYNI